MLEDFKQGIVCIISMIEGKIESKYSFHWEIEGVILYSFNFLSVPSSTISIISNFKIA